MTNFLGWDSLAGEGAGVAHGDVARRTLAALAADTARNLRAFVDVAAPARGAAPAPGAPAWDLVQGVPEVGTGPVNPDP
jgi:hypothetical protein